MATINSSGVEQKKPASPFAAGAAIGVGGGVAKPGGTAPKQGAAVGVGGGIAQGSPAPAPSGGGAAPAGGGSGVDWGTLAALQQAGLSSQDILALGAGGGQQAPMQQQAMGPAPSGADIYGTMPGAVTTSGIPDAQQAGMMSDPALLALLAGYDADLNNQIGDYRRQQDETKRKFADSQPMFEQSWDQNRNKIRNSFEARGLLKSGGTEDAVSRSYAQQGDAWSQQEASVADAVANLEQQIARARISNGQARSSAMINYAPGQPLS